MENKLGEQVEITDTPLKDYFDGKLLFGTKNPNAKDFFLDDLIETLNKKSTLVN